MKFLALEVEQPGATAAQYQPYLKAEALRIWQLYQEEVIREAYFRSDQHTAVLVLECESSTQASQVLATLPLVQQRLIEFEIIPLSPYPGFSRLFAE